MQDSVIVYVAGDIPVEQRVSHTVVYTVVWIYCPDLRLAHTSAEWTCRFNNDRGDGIGPLDRVCAILINIDSCVRLSERGQRGR